MRFTNPIIPGFYPDPSVCRVGNDYYMVTSSFEYFPGVPIFHSRDIVNWRQIGHCLTRPSQLPLEKERCSGGIYAPTIRYNDGTFYMVTTNVREPRHFYVHTKDPAGEWSKPVWTESHNIDPSLFFDDDGKAYFTCNGNDGIYQWLIDIKTGERLSEIRHIWKGNGGYCAEAPHLYKFFGQYYLMIAEGGTEYGHMETIARSDSPWGPWEPCPYNPILTHRNHNGYGISGTGHADIFEAHDGSWWAVFLAFRPVQGNWHHLGRETFLAPVKWVDGWPIIGGEEGYPFSDRLHGKGTVRIEMEGPTLPQHEWPQEPERDNFDSPELGLCWNFLRNPQMENYSLSEKPGHLRLHGTGITLNDVDSPTCLCRRQCHFECSVTTIIDFAPKRKGDEAGLVVLMNNRHHYEIAMTLLDDDKAGIIVRRRIGDLQSVVAEARGIESPVKLRIVADHEKYIFSFASELAGKGTSEFKSLASGETRYLSSEVAGGFTGVYFGLYATGKGEKCFSPADFDWFEYLQTS